MLVLVPGPPPIRGSRGEQCRQLCDDAPESRWLCRFAELWADEYVIVFFFFLVL